MDSTKNKVANGTVVKILRLPYLENVLERTQWRGITQYLPYGNYLTEGNFKGIIRMEQLEVKPDSTTEIEFIFNIRQVRLTYQCFRSQAKAPASGVEVQIINSRGIVIENLNRWRGSFNLPEGIYTLQARFQGQTINRTIHLYASETTAMQEDIYFDKKE